MPQTSATSIRHSQCAYAAGSVRSHTPSSTGTVLAMWLASLASVLVGPMPTQVGIPVQARTVARRSRASSTRKPGATSDRFRKLSSME